MNSIDNVTLNKANEEGILNIYSYLSSKNAYSGSAENKTLDVLLYDIEVSGTEGWEPEDFDMLNVMKNAINENESLKDIRLIRQNIEPKGLKGFVFERPNQDISVVFSGTRKGEWIDNGEALSGIAQDNTYTNGTLPPTTTSDFASTQQSGALDWFNDMSKELGWSDRKNITISGHSKGGNKAQFITINSDLIDQCYSFDGQGFSPEAIERFNEQYGSEFEKRRQKIISICADNDYVNVLGETIVPEENKIYLDAPLGEDNILAYHFMHAMLGSNGKFNDQCEQGSVAAFIKGVSDDIMKLPPPVRQYSTLGVMNLLQLFYANSPAINGDNVSALDTAIGIAVGVPIIAFNLMKIDEVQAFIDEKLNSIGKIFGPKYEAAATVALISVVVVSAAIITAFAASVTYVAVTIQKLGERLKKLAETIYSQVAGFINSSINRLMTWGNKNLNPGYRYAVENTQIRVDTARLRAYADRLERVNARVTKLDRQLDRLYTKVGFTDLWSLIRADLLTGYSWRLKKCIGYLDNTASDFESAERRISSKL